MRSPYLCMRTWHEIYKADISNSTLSEGSPWCPASSPVFPPHRGPAQQRSTVSNGGGGQRRVRGGVGEHDGYLIHPGLWKPRLVLLPIADDLPGREGWVRRINQTSQDCAFLCRAEHIYLWDLAEITSSVFTGSRPRGELGQSAQKRYLLEGGRTGLPHCGEREGRRVTWRILGPRWLSRSRGGLWIHLLGRPPRPYTAILAPRTAEEILNQRIFTRWMPPPDTKQVISKHPLLLQASLQRIFAPDR